MIKLPKLTQNKDNYYSIRFRVSSKLQPYFKRTFISKSLETKDYNKAKRRLYSLYTDYKKLKDISSMVTEEQLQTIVNNFIVTTLEQDLISRAKCGQGSARTTSVVDSTKAVTERHVLLDELEAVSVGLEDGDYSIAKHLLKINGEPTDEPLLNYYMMLAYKAVTEEAVARASQKIPNNAEAIAKNLLKNFQNQTQTSGTITPKSVNDIKAVVTLEDAINQFLVYYKQKAKDPESKSVSDMEVALNLYRDFTGATTDITSLDLTALNNFKYFLSNKPIASKAIYKQLKPSDIIEMADEIPDKDIIASKTQRESLMKLKQLFSYCEDLGLIDLDPSKRLILPDKKSGNTRAIFSAEDKEAIYRWLNSEVDDRRYLYYILANTGMRLSELYKCKFEFDEASGLSYFSLLNAETKTQSSKRRIPLNNTLLEMGITKDKFEKLRTKYKQDNLGYFFNHNLENVIESSENKVCYSFRHTVATELLRLYPEKHLVISKILGHSHKDDNLTTTNYFKGFDLEQLKELLDNLS